MRLARILLIVILAFALIGAAALGAAWFWRDALLSALQPRIEQELAGRLDARVDLGILTLNPEFLRIENVDVEKEGRYQIAVPEALIRFTFSGLLAGRLDALEIRSPRVFLHLPTEEKADREAEIPQEPPFVPDRLRVRDGELILATEGHKYRFSAIDLQARGDPLTFELSTRVGGKRQVALRTAGRLRWQPQLRLTLEMLQWGEEELLAASLQITPAGKGDLLSGEFALVRLRDEDVSRVAAAFGRPDPIPVDLGFQLEDLQAEINVGEDGFSCELSAAEGRLSYAGRRLPFTRARFSFENKQEAWRGEATLRPSEQGPMRIQLQLEEDVMAADLEWSIPQPDALQRLVFGDVSLATRGAVRLQAAANGPPENLRIRMTAVGEAGERPGDYLIDLASLRAEATFGLSAAGVEVEGEVAVNEKKVLRISGTAREMSLDIGPLATGNLAAVLPETLLPEGFEVERLQGAATFRRDDAAWSLPLNLRFERLSWKGAAVRDGLVHGRLTGSGKSSTLHIEQMKAALNAQGVKANLSGAAKARLRPGATDIRVTTLQVTDLEYLSPSGDAGLVGASLQAEGTVAQEKSGRFLLDLSGGLTPGEVLKGSLYADLRSWETSWKVSGEMDPGDLSFRDARIALAVDALGNIEGSGLLAPETFDLQIGLSLPHLKRALEERLRPALGGSFAVLRNLESGGGLEADLTLRGQPDDFRLTGRVKPQSVDLILPGPKLEIRGLSGELPIRYASGEPAFGQVEKPGIGTLVPAYARFGPARLAQRPLQIEARRNRLSLLTPLVFHLAGGTLSFNELGGGWEDQGLEASTQVWMADVDLQELTAIQQWPAVEGNLSADLGRIRYAAGTLSTQGQAVIDVFDGRVTLEQIRGERLDSPYPVYSGDIDYRGIDLERLTRTFEFGEIRGVVHGYVKNLRLFGTTPTHFTASLESLEKGERSLSVKAVRNLTVISQGGLAGVLSSGIYRFIDFYNYQKIGIYCALENDVFTLEGTALDSGNYLVYGGWLPPKINIVAPVHNISFKEMLKRLDRIGRTD